jgi:hypothetical protein
MGAISAAVVQIRWCTSKSHLTPHSATLKPTGGGESREMDGIRRYSNAYAVLKPSVRLRASSEKERALIGRQKNESKSAEM